MNHGMVLTMAEASADSARSHMVVRLPTQLISG